MEAKNITIKYISRTFGVAPGTVTRWLNLHSEPHPAMQKALLEELEKLPDEDKMTA
jgi:hypothetical protein